MSKKCYEGVSEVGWSCSAADLLLAFTLECIRLIIYLKSLLVASGGERDHFLGVYNLENSHVATALKALL